MRPYLQGKEGCCRCFEVLAILRIPKGCGGHSRVTGHRAQGMHGACLVSHARVDCAAGGLSASAVRARSRRDVGGARGAGMLRRAHKISKKNNNV